MATAVSEEPQSPILANIVVLLGFAAVFSTFATDSPWSWIIGVVMIVSGGLWAGFAPRGDSRDGSTAH